MVCGPSLARSLFVFSQDKENDVRLLGYLHRVLYAPGIQSRIAKHHFVGAPIRHTLRDLASLGIEDFHILANLVANSLQNADASAGIIAVPAKMNVGSVRSDNGNAFVLGLVQRQKLVLIFLENDGLARGLQGKLLMLRAVGNFLSRFRVYIRVVEKSCEEFHTQNIRHRAIYRGFSNFAFCYLGQQTSVCLSEWQLD